MRWALTLGAALLCAIGAPAFAVDASPPLADPVLQQRYLGLTRELRCVKCQNEAIADSPVEIAADLRREVREAIVAGQSDQQIRDLLVSRYGEFILFRPRWSARNALLWLAPGLMLLGGAFVGWRIVRRRGALLANDPSTVDSESESS
jgi:cytochrome c-type biogenesis protein CcmH